MSEQEGFIRDSRGTAKVALLAIRSIDMSVSTFLRHSMGRRWGDRESLLLIPVMLVYSYVWHREPYSLAPLWWFLLAVFVRRATHRLRRITRLKSMQGVHTEYSGAPYLCSVFPRLPELAVKRFVEPVLVALAGFLGIAWNSPLGCYLILAAICMKLLNLLAAVQLNLQIDRVQDSLISQKLVAERLREQHGEFL